MRATNQRDYFAEMYVAAILADAGWNIYFPRRDNGFDFIVTKKSAERVIVRPVQVKGKYPEITKVRAGIYGYVGKLSLLHDDMVLVIVYFPFESERGLPPATVAFLPHSKIKRTSRGGHRCQPAKYQDGVVRVRRDYARYFDAAGLAAMTQSDWK